ncbi:response regulator [Paenibacillus tarimensis]
MKILIADDDDYTRQGLVETIEWEKYGIDNIMQAKDGAEALRIASLLQPDIVLTDIRMPKLSGIELAEKLAEKCGDSKLLFMSAYMDIAYLKSAIKLSAVDYIEKPIKLHEIEAAIQKTVDYIHQKQKLDDIADEKKDLQRQKLADLLKNKTSHMNEIIHLCGEIDFPADKSYVCLVAWHTSGELSQENAISALNAFWKSNRIPSVCAYLGENKYLVILALEKQDVSRVKYAADLFVQRNNRFYAGLGALTIGLADVPESCQTALAALDRSFYHPHIRSFHYDKQKREADPGSDLYSDFLHILKNEPNKLSGWFESVCTHFSEMEYPGKEKVNALFYSFAQAMLREKNNLIVKLDRICSLEELEQSFCDCISIHEVKQLMLQLIVAYNEEVEQTSHYSRVVRDVMDYIASHCSNVDLDVREIAEHVHLSTAHLGMLFKHETGMTMKQYMGEYRLELAKKLLVNEHYRINVIAELCGYASASYFTKVFREATGLTPMEYRRMAMQ